MTSVPGPAFRDHLAELDRETATAFVAAVYDARGWTVSSGDEDGDVALLATPPQSDHTRRLVVCVGGTADCNGEAGIDRTVVDAATLYELLAYALPPSDRDRLCRAFFDREFESIGAPPAAAEPPDRDDRTDTASHETAVTGAAGRARDAGTTDPDPSAADARGVAGTAEGTAEPDGDGSENAGATADEEGPATATASTTRRERIVRSAGVVVALSLIFGGIVTAAGPALTESAATTFGGDGPASDDDSAPGNQSIDADAPPPGLDGDGVGHAGRLADAHEAALSNRSFRLHIVHREFVDGELRGVANERAVVTASGRYRSETRRLGQVDYSSEVIGDGATYSNGVRRYVRSDDVGDAANESPRLQLRTTMTAADPNRVVDRAERYVQWYLSVESSRLAGVLLSWDVHPREAVRRRHADDDADDDRCHCDDEAVEQELVEAELREQLPVVDQRHVEDQPVRWQVHDGRVRLQPSRRHPEDGKEHPDAHEDPEAVLDGVLPDHRRGPRFDAHLTLPPRLSGFPSWSRS